ncbi:MAG: RnfH family protein [Coxiellaceae bacterium]|nr:RnfH family protein [Coxiellaceae bacterium]
MIKKITVAYAVPDQQIELMVSVRGDCSVQEAIVRSGILEQFTNIDLSTQVVGVNSRRVSLTQQLESGDRVEIYRKLRIDPMQARRLRVERKTD